MLVLHKNLETYLKDSLLGAFPELFNTPNFQISLIEPLIIPASKAGFGDYQVNCALSLAKKLKKSPREIAKEIKAQLNANKLFVHLCEEPEIAGPGFINLKIKKNILIGEVNKMLSDESLGIERLIPEESISINNHILIDFSSPNIAKEMHVGHLRSTIIGDSLARLFEFKGYAVTRINHVGDWGTQFGMLIAYIKKFYPKSLLNSELIDLGGLVEFYREAKKLFDNNEEFKEEARKEVVKLQSGDSDSNKAWQLICEKSRLEFNEIYKILDVKIKEKGESFYNNLLENVIKDLESMQLIINDDGAKCVLLKGILGKDGLPLPMIIQKNDGGYNYATTDLAAIRYRFQPNPEGEGASRLIYVTDIGQSNHFAGVFQIAERANWIPINANVQHVPFGLVQGKDGKKLKTRSGKTIKLRDLLDEAILRAEIDLRKRLKEEGREESEGFIKEVSRTVGIAAVKYADLSQHRVTNYQFSFDKMLSLQGNTAPYLLYALVRIAGITRKGGNIKEAKTKMEFNEEPEWDLIRAILKFDTVIAEVERELLPNRLCNYLFELSQVFNRFYDQIPLLKADEPQRSSRLSLCQLTGSILKLGMNLLGMPTLERM
tara:strand:+ start:5127 stop:6938 length:1812 start_codon:yes stop_codon:yes gene_type:complete